MAFRAGISPREFWELEYWELISCLIEHAEREKEKAKDAVALAWQNAYFTGLAFAGKLNALSAYINPDSSEKETAQQITPEEFKAVEARVQAAKKKGRQ